MKCKVCGDTGKLREVQSIIIRIKVPGPCKDTACVRGWHAMKYNKKKDLIHRASTRAEHGLVGRALCPKCGGSEGGCEWCKFTRFLVSPCRSCEGTGVTEEVSDSPPEETSNHEVCCPYCESGKHRYLGLTTNSPLD